MFIFIKIRQFFASPENPDFLVSTILFDGDDFVLKVMSTTLPNV